jgi:hypothetical protein
MKMNSGLNYWNGVEDYVKDAISHLIGGDYR